MHTILRAAMVSGDGAVMPAAVPSNEHTHRQRLTRIFHNNQKAFDKNLLPMCFDSTYHFEFYWHSFRHFSLFACSCSCWLVDSSSQHSHFSADACCIQIHFMCSGMCCVSRSARTCMLAFVDFSHFRIINDVSGRASEHCQPINGVVHTITRRNGRRRANDW